MESVIAGFRIERLLGEGDMGPVHEAVQLSLGRRVALRLLAGDAPVSAPVDHPNIVPVYEVGEREGRRFVVSRLVRGEPLDGLLDAGSLSPDRFDEVMDAVEDAVATAHRLGEVHGRLAAHNVIVDRAGTPFVTDFGLGRAGTEEDDVAALAALRSRRPRGRRRPAGIAAGVALLLGLVAVLLATGREGGADPVRSVGCAPDPDPNTPACTLGQEELDGRLVRVRADGVLRRWAVHGAAGELTLQVLRRRGGRTVRAGFSQMQRVSDPGRRSFGVDLNVQRGDRIGVLLGPGARVGLRMRPGARAQRWPGIRTPLPPSGTVRGELLLSADARPGKRAAAPRQLTGARAAAAASGRVLGEAEVEVPETGPVTVRLVRTGRAVALDSFSGRRRLARILVSGADVRGRVADLAGICEYPGAVCLQWLNDADAEPVVHAYSLARGGRRFRVIG